MRTSCVRIGSVIFKRDGNGWIRNVQYRAKFQIDRPDKAVRSLSCLSSLRFFVREKTRMGGLNNIYSNLKRG